MYDIGTMKLNTLLPTLVAPLLALLLISGCQQLPPLPQADLAPEVAPLDLEKIQGETLDDLWDVLETNYIYAQSLPADLPAMQAKYRAALDAGELSNSRFDGLLAEIVAEFDDGAIELRSRDLKIEQVINGNAEQGIIGATVALRSGEDARLIVHDVIRNSPAARAGLAMRDVILEIDGLSIEALIARAEESGRDIEEIETLIDGPPDTTVDLMVRKPNGQMTGLTVARAVVPQRIITNGRSLNWVVEPSTNILYILFPSSNARDLLRQLSGIIEQATESESEPINGIVLDLRIWQEADELLIYPLLPIFLDGVVAIEVDANGRTPLRVNGVPSLFQDNLAVPLAILVGPETGGAGEQLAGIFQDVGRATVIGSPTQGRVESTERFFLTNGSELVLPTWSVETINSQTLLGREGVIPNVETATDWDQFTFVNDPSLAAAYEFIVFVSQLSGSQDG